MTIETHIHPGQSGLLGELRALPAHVNLIYVLSFREIQARYKQSFLGIGLAVLQPLMMLVVFVFLFGTIAKVDTAPVPYVVFAFAGLLPWLYVQKGIANGGSSLVALGGIFTKVYAPRLIVPLVPIAVAAVDLLIAFVLLEGVAIAYGFWPSWRLLLFPMLVLYGAFVALSFSLWAAALNVDYRDVGHMLPYIVQALMYFSPVAYPTSHVPEGLLRNLILLNPIAAYLDLFRWMVLGTNAPSISALLISIGIGSLLFAGGTLLFLRVARTFADRL